jgi:hypothetical protein
MNEITAIADIYKQMRLDEAKCNKKMNESHYEIGDKVRCKASGMTGKVVKTDDPETGAYYSVETEKGVKKYSPDELEAITTEELDPVGKADDDIDNDGDVDSSDKYLKKRRKAISKSVKDDEKEDKIEEAVELAEASIDQTSKQIQQGVKDYPVKQQKSSKLKTILSKTKNKLEEARADYKRQISGSHKVKATVCYIDPMSRQRKCEDLFFKSKMDALGFKDNVKGFPKGAEVEAISEK